MSVAIYRIVHHEMLDEPRAIERIDAMNIQCDGYEIRDVKFDDDKSIVVLLEAESE